ncbi:helix-turn-helix domain-containing protein [Actinacidiphila yeochonensis]|uniref:helix-turn-helix domain-containing protein n=1 Tax=Actinacidiphila yeochonensis TaxID=89050 RepID=UPI000562C2B4|nr:helix-turn-helix domain-containing protein [Actinacidiphila yeochonensis]
MRGPAREYGLPLLASERDHSEWEALAPRLARAGEEPAQRHPVRHQPVQRHPVQESPVRRHPVQEPPVQHQPVQESPVQHRDGRLAGLLERLPAPGGDLRTAVGRLTAFLADQLDAEVAVGTGEGVLAAAPATARAALAPFLARPSRTSAASEAAPTSPPSPAPWPAPEGAAGPGGPVRGPDQRRTQEGRFARTIPLTGDGDAVLVVATQAPAPPPDRGFADYTARALTLTLSGLREQRARRVMDETLREVRLSAFQLLMTGNTVSAQRVMAGLAHRLLDCERARVFILDCARAGRDAVLAEAELVLGDRAMAVRCPAFQRHVIVVAPCHHGTDPEARLRGLLDTFAGQRVLLGGSLDHALEAVADAYGEALDALTRSPHSPDRAVMAARATGVLDVLPPGPARSWAATLLRPVLLLPRGGGPALETAAAALEFEAAAAAKVTGVHRNTVTRRTRQVFDAVGLDQEEVLDRVVLSLAAQLLARHGTAPAEDGDPGLHALLTGSAVRSWGERTLRPLAADRRDLLRTVRAWVGCGCRVGPAAEELGLAAKTVRAHIRAAERLLDRDLLPGLPEDPVSGTGYRLASIRPLAVALYAAAGPDGRRPPLPLRPVPRPAPGPGAAAAAAPGPGTGTGGSRISAAGPSPS